MVRNIIVLGLLLLPTTFAQADEPKGVKVPQADVVPFLKQHCLRCHNEDDQNGDFRIDTVAWSIKTEAQAETWQEVLDVLNAGEMPPDSEPRPKDRDLVKVLGILTGTLTRARDVLSDAGTAVPIRRLNKREYIQSIKHLFGLNVNPYAVPADLRGDHFDTLGEAQFFDAASFDKYLRLGTEIAKEGLRWSGRPYEKAKTTRSEAEEQERKKLKKFSEYFKYPKAEDGRYLYSGNRATKGLSVRLGDDPRATYRVRVHAGLTPDAHPLRRGIVLAESSGVLGVAAEVVATLRIHGTVKKPMTEEIVIGHRILGPGSKPELRITESRPAVNDRGFRRYLNEIGDKSEFGTIWIDWMEVEGPIYQSKQNVLGSLIGNASGKQFGNLNIRSVVQQFATEAFRRRQPDPKYIDALLNHYQALTNSGTSDVDALAETLGIVLASPGFLYLEEDSDSGTLTPTSFATRLSYFLWSCPPDEELYRVAKSGKILNADELRRQVDRMLDDPKADSFFEGFMGQWAELERLNGISVDMDQYPGFNGGFKYSTRREAIEFFKVMIQENMSVDKLIDSDFVVVNALLADHYGLPGGDYSNEFESVKLPKKSPRGGLITQSAFLLMGSDGNRSSPVIRGALLMDKLLNMPPPPPPPNVPELAAASDFPVSNRKIVELHQKQTACASCHKRMDPIGFGLENFDVIGQWRDTEQVGKKAIPIKASATLVTGVKFKNLGQLKELLQSQRHRLANGMVESLLAYGLGRENSFSDQDAVDAILKQSKKNDYRMREIIFGIVNSEPFQNK